MEGFVSWNQKFCERFCNVAIFLFPTCTAWNVSKHGVFSGLHSVQLQEKTDQKKTSYLDTFHAMLHLFWLFYFFLETQNFNLFLFFFEILELIQHKFRERVTDNRSNRSEVFLVKAVLKMCCKFAGEHPCRSAISIRLLHWSRTSAWVFSCKFAAYFQNTFY